MGFITDTSTDRGIVTEYGHITGDLKKRGDLVLLIVCIVAPIATHENIRFHSYRFPILESIIQSSVLLRYYVSY
jgi:predicted nucleic acid-binding protein